MKSCEHPDWVNLDSWPGAMACVDCGVWRDLLPQHHLYRMRMPLHGPFAANAGVLKIDAHIVDLVDRTWQAGFETTGSCEGGCYDRWLATIELRRTARTAVGDCNLIAGLYHDLRDVGMEVKGDLVFVSWEPSWRCPMYDQERELVEKSGGRTTQSVIR